MNSVESSKVYAPTDVQRSQSNPSSTKQINADLRRARRQLGFFTSSVCKAIYALLITIAATAAIGIPLAIVLTKTTTTSTSATTSVASTTVMTTAPYTCSNFTIQYNYDYPGSDINDTTSLTFSGCCFWCMATSGCVMIAYLNTSNHCWIKYARVLPGNAYSNMISLYQ